MSRTRASSSPDLVPEASTTTSNQQYDDSALEGVASHVKLLLKLIEDHKGACDKERNSRRRMLRVATMMTILDNVRTRLQRCQSFGKNKSVPELRRCDTAPRDKRQGSDPLTDEKEKLRRELSTSLAARKSLEIMCSSLGKEKEIMAGELSRKAHELSEMEELVNDIRAQNETLLGKLKQCNNDSNGRDKKFATGGESQGSFALQERNKELSERLLRSLDGYRALKRKLKEVQENNLVMRGAMEETGEKFETALRRVRTFKERSTSGNLPDDVREEISNLEKMFSDYCNMIAVKHDQNSMFR